MKAIPRFHVITDEQLQQRWTHVQIARFAIEGGAHAIQYREKRQLGQFEVLETATLVAAECRKADIPLIVNDHTEVAGAVGAAGVHLGREDTSPRVAHNRRPELVIGSTVNSLEEAQAMSDMPTDYLGAGPVYGTQSKVRPAQALGLHDLAQICRKSNAPVIAIGGIQPEHVPDVIQAGAWGFAVLGGVACASNPASATKAYSDALREALARGR